LNTEGIPLQKTRKKKRHPV